MYTQEVYTIPSFNPSHSLNDCGFIFKMNNYISVQDQKYEQSNTFSQGALKYNFTSTQPKIEYFGVQDQMYESIIKSALEKQVGSYNNNSSLQPMIELGPPLRND